MNRCLKTEHRRRRPTARPSLFSACARHQSSRQILIASVPPLAHTPTSPLAPPGRLHRRPSRASGQRRSALWSQMGSRLILKTLILMVLQSLVTVGDTQFQIAAGLRKD
ncbi:hypothetical protein PVAP13_8NG110201 [Panicum virgatum]|uniref:Uncharacterized protein n=1 Tax=Panicum virgatum TaxID=38727 RepID=A0A8T0PBP4_PANVG|nr:hypothetical protein PVAP13_8NG110201 [Panicum virgatum]